MLIEVSKVRTASIIKTVRASFRRKRGSWCSDRVPILTDDLFGFIFYCAWS